MEAEGGGEVRGGEGRCSGLPPTHNFWLRHCYFGLGLKNLVLFTSLLFSLFSTHDLS